MRVFTWIIAFVWLADAIILFAGLREPSTIGSGISKGIIALFLMDMARKMGDKKKTEKLATKDAVSELLLGKDGEDQWHK